jgi:N utilization substance protein B
VRTRTKARQRAAEALYEAEVRSVDAIEVIERNPDANEYTSHIVSVVQEHTARIDETISTFSQSWSLDRMPAVDRAILRVAVAELLFEQELDAAVIISEAVEVAANIGSEEAGSFLNGVLGQVATVRNTQSDL